MPHLTSAATDIASTDLRVGLGDPGYAHPLESLRPSGANSPAQGPPCTGPS